MVTENGFRSRSNSFDSDASSANSSEHNLESEEMDPEQNSDSSSNNINFKRSNKADKSNEHGNNVNNMERRKNCSAYNFAQNDKNSISSFLPSHSNQFQEVLNDENSNLSTHGLRIRSPKGNEKSMNKVKRENPKSEFINKEVGVQNPLTGSSFAMIDESRPNNRYSFESEAKNFKADIDKLKTENEDDCIKPLDRNDIAYNKSVKRSSSANNSPYKEKRRNFFFEKMGNNHELLDQKTIHPDILPSALQKSAVTKIYYSYFERGNDDNDEIREIK